MTFYKQSQGMMICFDLTKPKTFTSVRRWVTAVEQNCEEGISTMLIGTKCDLTEERAVTREEAEQIAREHGMKYYETSARSNINIQEAFSDMIDSVYQNKFMDPNAEVKRDTIKLGGSKAVTSAAGSDGKKKKGCC